MSYSPELVTDFENQATLLTARIQEFEERLAQAPFRTTCEVCDDTDSSFVLRFTRRSGQWCVFLRTKHYIFDPEVSGIMEMLNPLNRKTKWSETRLTEASLSQRAQATHLFPNLVSTMKETYENLKEKVDSALTELDKADEIFTQIEEGE